MSRLVRWWAGACGLSLGAACSGGTAPVASAPSGPSPSEAPAPVAVDGPAAPAPRPDVRVDDAHPNVIVITLDTLRADRVGAWGYDKALTDTIDGLAARGRRYASAWSPLPLTIPSHSTLFTGKYPPKLGIRSNGQGRLEEVHTTLAEVLQGSGWSTGAATAAFVTTRMWGFNQGFDAYFDKIPEGEENFWHGERPGGLVVDDALGWVASLTDDRPVFLWVHMYDAHFPYKPAEADLKRAGGRPYDGEVAYLDDQVDRLVKAFADEPTLFVIAADHGEGLGDHGELTHGLYAYAATQHVPLILAGPGIAPAVIEKPVSLADVTPTVLDLLKIPIPAGVDGHPVHTDADASPVYVETWQLAQRFHIAPHIGVVEGPLQLLRLPRPELYDLSIDPGQTTNLAEIRPDDVARLSAHLDRWAFPPPDASSSTDVDPDAAAQLAALGYVDASGAIPTGPLPDPKDKADLITGSQRAERFGLTGEPKRAEALLRQLIAANPSVIEFRTRLAGLLSRQERFPEARQVMEEALVIDPTNPQLRVAHAGHLAADGKFAEAAEVYRALATELPYMPRIRALTVAAVRHIPQGQAAEAGLGAALALGQPWLQANPTDKALAGLMGTLLMEAGRGEEALALLEVGATADKPELDVCYLLGARAIGRGDLLGATELFRRETEGHPQNVRAWSALAKVALRVERWQDAADASAAVLARSPGDLEMWHARVLSLFNLGRYGDARTAVDAGLKVDPQHPDLLLMDANLLAKEGKLAEGKVRFEAAQHALAARRGQEPAPTPPPAQDLGMPVDDGSWGAK